MTRAAALLLLALPGCAGKVADPSKLEGVINCDELALRGEDGAADSCDLQACLACVDFCGLDCTIAESYPPQYGCPSIGSYTVYDFCPDWGAGE